MIYQSHNSVGTNYFNPIIYENFHFLPHMHRHCEAILVLDGEVNVTVGTRTEVAKKGDAAIILGNQLHSFSTDSTSKVWVCVFSEDHAGSFFKMMKGKVGERSVFRCPEEVTAYFYYAGSCGENTDVYARKAFIYMLCSEYVGQIPLTEGSERGGELLHGIMTYISNHYREDVTLTGIAAELGYEPHYLSRFFHKTVNLNLKKLINQYRVSYAMELLTEGNMDITAVATECGFQSVRNFNRVFLAETGMVPGAVSRDNSGVKQSGEEPVK